MALSYPSSLGLAQLTALAPTELHSFRINRFRGEENPVRLDDLEPDDLMALKTIYGILSGLFSALRTVYESPIECLQAVRHFLRNHSDDQLINAAQQLGMASREKNPSERLSRIFHDLRGGALPSLSMRLQLMDYPSTRPEDAPQIFFLTRDHLKIMRNCVADIDAQLREADSQQQDHHLQLLIEKWTEAQLGGAQSDLHVEVTCFYEGVICESCLEFSTLDRIIYNMMNNAARFAADGRVQFSMLPVPAEKPANIRFVVANQVTPEQSEILTDRFGDTMGNVLRGGFTTGGNGLGLRICADFCSQAYGVANFEKALEDGYFGAELQGNLFLIWFHWPLQPE